MSRHKDEYCMLVCFSSNPKAKEKPCLPAHFLDRRMQRPLGPTWQRKNIQYIIPLWPPLPCFPILAFKNIPKDVSRKKKNQYYSEGVYQWVSWKLPSIGLFFPFYHHFIIPERVGKKVKKKSWGRCRSTCMFPRPPPPLSQHLGPTSGRYTRWFPKEKQKKKSC